MAADRTMDDGIEDFLAGDTLAVAAVRSVVERSVRSFRFEDASLAAELAQESLSRIFFNLSSGRFRAECSLKTYASRVTRYTCLEHLRRRRLEVQLDAESLPCRERWAEPEESFLWTEEHLRNLEIFSSLPSSCRELLKLVFIEKLSYREVGLKLGLSEAAIKTRVHRCRITFRRCAGMDKPRPLPITSRRVRT